MKKIFFFLFILSACGTAKEVAEKLPVKLDLRYNIQPNLIGETPMLNVSFLAPADENGILHLWYPNQGWGEKNLFNSLKDLKVSPKCDIQYLKEKDEILIKGDPNKTYTISYSIVQDFTEKLTTENIYRPIVNKEYFHVFGKNLFMMPSTLINEMDLPFDVQIIWESLNGEYDVVNSFGSEKTQKFSATYAKFCSTIFMGGNLNTNKLDLPNGSLVYSTPDKWEYIDTKKLTSDLYRIVLQQKEFWKDQSSDPTTVTMIKTFENCPSESNCANSCIGTGLTNSFATGSSDNIASTNERLRWLYAHELFHHWVGMTIVNESEEIEYWFSEGFTDYYTYKLLLKNGMLTMDEFVKRINEDVIEPHYNSPLRNKSNGEITREKFWSDKEWEKLPYRRGLIYALYLDTKIKGVESSISLDEFMLDILAFTQTNKVKFNQSVFLENLYKYKLPDYDIEYDQFIEQGNPIDLTQLRIPGIYFEKGKVPYMRFQDGFANDETKAFLVE